MEKKKIDIQENIIDTESFVPETEQNAEQQEKVTYRQEKAARVHRVRKSRPKEENDQIEDFFDKRIMQKKHRRRIVIGAVMCALMLIGVGTIVAGGVKITAKIFDNSEEKARYNALLAPLVVADPLPFESPDQADQDLLLSSSVWAAVMNEDMEQYEKNDFGQTYLPAVDVDRYFARVFGTQYTLQHRTFADQEVEFQFDEEKQAYIVPVTSFPSGFTPDVVKIKKGSGEKIVTVGYISPTTSWTDTSDGAISKYVDYILQKQGQNYCLVAVRESDMKVAVTASN